MNLIKIIEDSLEILNDTNFSNVNRWKEENKKKVIGNFPIYAPKEIIHAADMLPVTIMGNNTIEVNLAHKYFQAFYCSIIKSTTELMLTKRLDFLDGMVFTSICDDPRNLSGMWQMLFPELPVFYLDFPQNLDYNVSGELYANDLRRFAKQLSEISNKEIADEGLFNSIDIYNKNRELVRSLYKLRSKKPWNISAYESYILLKIGNLIPVEEHSRLLTKAVKEIENRNNKRKDNIRVLIEGAFCEQPPIALIKTIESLGCYIVDDDFIKDTRWFNRDIIKRKDPYDSLSYAYIVDSTYSTAKYDYDILKKELILKKVKDLSIDLVIFCYPNFCKPAECDQPTIISLLNKEKIQHVTIEYEEANTKFAEAELALGTIKDTNFFFPK